MATLDQMRDGFARAWAALAEGWNHLRSRASQALTSFQPVRRSGELQTSGDQVMVHAARWGLLPAEVIEHQSDILVKLEIPGMRGDDFEIHTVDDVLVVRGEKMTQSAQEHGRYHVLECAYGSFERAIPLPTSVGEQGARATYRRGVLEITLPKASNSSPRRIPVHAT
jgi:HSP20 family protein